MTLTHCFDATFHCTLRWFIDYLSGVWRENAPMPASGGCFTTISGRATALSCTVTNAQVELCSRPDSAPNGTNRPGNDGVDLLTERIADTRHDAPRGRPPALKKELDQFKKLEADWHEKWIRIAYHARGKGISIDDLDKPFPEAGRK